MNRFPGRFASAMIVSPEDDGRHIRRWAERGIVGIRFRPIHVLIALIHSPNGALQQTRPCGQCALCMPSALLGDAFTEVD